MGGLACLVPRNAIMAGTTLPEQPENASDPQYVTSCIAFDAKLRQVFAQSDIVAGIVDADLALTVCPILAKSPWTAEERETLWNALNTLWPTTYGT